MSINANPAKNRSEVGGKSKQILPRMCHPRVTRYKSSDKTWMSRQIQTVAETKIAEIWLDQAFSRWMKDSCYNCGIVVSAG